MSIKVGNETFILPLSTVLESLLRIPANVTGHYGDRDRFAHGLHAGESFVR